MQLIFFASWCASCIPHLKEQHGKDTIFIAAFDEKTKAEKVLDYFKVGNDCYMGDEIAKELKIQSLPAVSKQNF